MRIIWPEIALLEIHPQRTKSSGFKKTDIAIPMFNVALFRIATPNGNKMIHGQASCYIAIQLFIYTYNIHIIQA